MEDCVQPLTARQTEIARLIADSHTYEEVAIRLGTTRSNVSKHALVIRKKLDITDSLATPRARDQLVAKLRAQNLI